MNAFRLPDALVGARRARTSPEIFPRPLLGDRKRPQTDTRSVDCSPRFTKTLAVVYSSFGARGPAFLGTPVPPAGIRAPSAREAKDSTVCFKEQQ